MSGSVNIPPDAEEFAQIFDVAEALATAIADPHNWDGGGAPGLTITDRQRDGVWLSPTAPLRFRQPTVPLNVAIERFGTAKLDSPQTFKIETVTIAGAAAATIPLTSEFAPGMFLDFTQEEMLALHGFETLEAGVEISRPLQSGAAVSTIGEFEEIVMDPKARPAGGPNPLSGLIVGALTVFTTSKQPPAKPVLVRRERFSVVDGSLQVQASGTTLFQARAALQQGWRAVPQAEAI